MTLHAHRRIWILFILLVFASWAFVEGQDSSPQDLNRIIRVKPSPTAAKIGTAVHWEPNWEVALKKSNSSGKPIFWYVPTVPGTFMDRKTEIDRYMLAGPFSWPATIERLNRDFIPLRAPPTAKLAEAFELQPYKFVEPGFLIVGPDQKVRMRVDHLTTLHPIWFDQLVAQAAPNQAADPKPVDPDRAEMDRLWHEFASTPWPRVGEMQTLAATADGDKFATEFALLSGMAAYRSGNHELAKETWRNAAKAQPDSPLAWKAAAEAEGIGPFVRGFEVFSPLPEKAFRAGIDSPGSAAPSQTYSEAELWLRGVDFLLGMQADNGGFFDSDYDFGGFDSLSNVYVAVTSLAGMALLESIPRVEGERLANVRDAITRTAEFVSDEKNLNPQDTDEILWAQAYRVRLLARLVHERFGETPKYQAALDRAVKGLEQIQLRTGGWQHEYANPFVTATALSALHFAQESGATIDTQKVERGLASLANDRSKTGAYPYMSTDPSRKQQPTSVQASAGRIPVCEMALWQWRKIDDRQLEQAARTSLDHQRFLDVAYKYDNHTSTLAYGGFFFWYDMHARAELIARIKDDATRTGLATQHRELILKLPEIDGCFVDSHELGRCYGTAMALLSLSQLE